MMLLQVRNYIQREGRVSLQQLTREFRMDESALNPLLDIWLKKGVISAHQPAKGCRSACAKCPTSAVVFYQSQH